MSIVVLAVVALVSLGFLIRLTLILSGRLKGIILRRWELYQPNEIFFDPVSHMSFWGGMALLSIGLLVAAQFRLNTPIYLLGAAGIAFGYWRSSRQGEPDDEPFPLPLWYAELVRRTTREERRHIAYRWLYLPDGTRRALSDNDAAFRLWADLMIVSTIQYTHVGLAAGKDSIPIWENWQ